MAELERIKKERAEEKLRKVCHFFVYLSILIFQCDVHLGFGSMIVTWLNCRSDNKQKRRQR
jgi:hypothetical protein